MKRSLIILLLLATACAPSIKSGSNVAWDGIKYSNHAALEPNNFLRMGK